MKTDKFKIVTFDGKELSSLADGQLTFKSESPVKDKSNMSFIPKVGIRDISFEIRDNLFAADLAGLISDRYKLQMIFHYVGEHFPRKMKKAVKTDAFNKTKFGRKAKNYLNRHTFKPNRDVTLSSSDRERMSALIQADIQHPDKKVSGFSLEDFIHQASARKGFPKI